jgi:hypothetical protein
MMFAMVAGTYCWRTKSFCLVTCVGVGSSLIFSVLMATTAKNTSIVRVWGYPAFVNIGIGLGLALATLMVAAQFATPLHLLPLPLAS